MTLNRRQLLTRGAAGVGIVATGNLTGLFGPSPLAGAIPPGRGSGPGYGALVSDPDGLLDLPTGFRYRVVSREGEPLTTGPGTVPGRFDGTAAFAGPDKSTFLVRNSEISGTYGPGAVTAGPRSPVYDPAAPGGTTTVQIDKHGNKVAEFVSIAGTSNNCAGGLTPWGTWLTCEEDERRAGSNGYTKDHGFVFEVDPSTPANSSATPITGMGRFAHEAVCIDPRTGTAYLTEDASGSAGLGLTYRYEPNNTTAAPGALHAGGSLAAMHGVLQGMPVANLAQFSEVGTTLDVEWVPVPDPLAATTPTRAQLADSQVTRSRKFEGCWWGNDRAWIVASFSTVDPYPYHSGQVWSYDPRRETLTLELNLLPGDPDLPGDSPDNVCVSPYGGLILAEDGDDTQYLVAVDGDGAATALARNAANESEFTGCCFSPDGKTLFANVQSPGVTFAITGPFARIRRG